MKTMIIAIAVAFSAASSAALAHPVARKPVATPDFAKQLFDQLERDGR